MNNVAPHSKSPGIEPIFRVKGLTSISV